MSGKSEVIHGDVFRLLFSTVHLNQHHTCQHLENRNNNPAVEVLNAEGFEGKRNVGGYPSPQLTDGSGASVSASA